MTTIITCPLCRETYTDDDLRGEKKGRKWDEDEQCPVCLNNENDYFKLNKCGHKLCKVCYNEMVTRGRNRRDELPMPPWDQPQWQRQQQQSTLRVPQLSALPPPQPPAPPQAPRGRFVQNLSGVPVWVPFSGGKKRKTKKRKGHNKRKKTRRRKQSRMVRKRKTRRR